MTASDTAFTGRCLCGDTRYRAESAPKLTVHCHCESCRRACGAPMVTWLGFEDHSVSFDDQQPRSFASSPGVERSFCPKCGSPLTFKSHRWPGEIHILAASLDDPEAARPTGHVYCNEMLTWMKPGDGLPQHVDTATALASE